MITYLPRPFWSSVRARLWRSYIMVISTARSYLAASSSQVSMCLGPGPYYAVWRNRIFTEVP